MGHSLMISTIRNIFHVFKSLLFLQGNSGILILCGYFYGYYSSYVLPDFLSGLITRFMSRKRLGALTP